MKSKEKGNMSPEIPASTWEFFRLARSVLGNSVINRVFGVEKSQIGRWASNPGLENEHQRNPVDRLRALFEEMIEAGEHAAVMAMISELSRPLGGPVQVCAPVEPERETVQDELLDIHPACTEHAQAIRMGQPVRVVEHWGQEARKQIDQATEIYRRGAQ